MANAAVTKRIEKFIEECKARMTLGAMDAPRMKSPGFAKKLAEEIGEDNLPKASFEEIIVSLDGCGIPAIEGYIARMDAENGLKFQESLPSEVSEDARQEKAEATETAKAAEPAMTDAVTAKEGSGEGRPAAERDVKRESAKKAPKKAPDADVLSILQEHKSVSGADKERIRELKRSLYLLERQKSIIARGVTIYRKDFNFLSALDRYSKTYPTEVAGVAISGMTSILHAASILLLKELAAGDNEELIKAIRENSDARDGELTDLNRKIEEVKKELDKLS